MNPDGSACAVWLPPGAPSEPSAFAGQSVALILDPGSLDAEQRARAAAIGKAMDASRPREPHYCLPFIAVANERRGEGRGSTLLGAPLRRIDDEGAPLKFIGDWRYVDWVRHLEPVAFQAMPEASPWADIYLIGHQQAEAA